LLLKVSSVYVQIIKYYTFYVYETTYTICIVVHIELQETKMILKDTQ